MRLGLLGGTFNPPHIGHLVCAQEALSQLELDVVRLVPAAAAPHKEVADDPGVDVRVELCRAAVDGIDGVEVSTVEAERDGPSYTVDTLRQLHEQTPGDDLTFIVGGDMAWSLPSWRDPAGILSLADLAVAEREELRRQEIVERLETLAAAADRVRFFDMPRLDVSSTEIRARVAEGRPIRWLVPAGVASLIEQKGLYRAPERVGETT